DVGDVALALAPALLARITLGIDVAQPAAERLADGRRGLALAGGQNDRRSLAFGLPIQYLLDRLLQFGHRTAKDKGSTRCCASTARLAVRDNRPWSARGLLRYLALSLLKGNVGF